MSAQIVINDGSGPHVGTIERDNSFIGTTFTFSNFDDTGVVAWRWTLTDRPIGSSAAPTSTSTSTMQVTADITGGYLVRLETFADAERTILLDADEQLVGVAFAAPYDWQVPAAGETKQRGDRGWATPVERMIRQLRTFVESGGGASASMIHAALTGSVANWSPAGYATGVDGIAVTSISVSNPVLDGLAGGVAGRKVAIANLHLVRQVVMRDSATSAATASNRIDFGGRDFYLPPRASVLLEYDGVSSRWRSIATTALPALPGLGRAFTFSDFQDAASAEGWLALTDKGQILLAPSLGGVGFSNSAGTALLIVNAGGDFANNCALLRANTPLICDVDNPPVVTYRVWMPQHGSDSGITPDRTRCSFQIGVAAFPLTAGPTSAVTLSCDAGTLTGRTLNSGGLHDDAVSGFPSGDILLVRLTIGPASAKIEVSNDEGATFVAVCTTSVVPDQTTYVPYLFLENDGPGTNDDSRVVSVDWCATSSERVGSNPGVWDGSAAVSFPQLSGASPGGSIQDVGTANNGGSNPTFARDDHTHRLTPAVLNSILNTDLGWQIGTGGLVDPVSIQGISVTIEGDGTGSIIFVGGTDFSNTEAQGLADPTSPSSAATANYVDAVGNRTIVSGPYTLQHADFGKTVQIVSAGATNITLDDLSSGFPAGNKTVMITLLAEDATTAIQVVLGTGILAGGAWSPTPGYGAWVLWTHDGLHWFHA